MLVVARDSGAAAALGPVARALIRAGLVTVSVVGYGQAELVFRYQGLPVLAVLDDQTPDVARLILEAERPDYLLTGTSMLARRDNAFWLAARESQIPSMAVLDHWHNYWQRFSDPAGARFAYLPDRVAVMDAVAHQAMCEAGCPPERLVITGHPYFDDLAAVSLPALASEARRELGLDPAEVVVVFASEPQAKYYGADARSSTFLGYTEEDALQMLFAAAREVAAGLDRPLAVIVKLHPLEGPERLIPLVQRTSGVAHRMIKHFPSHRLIAASDVMAGMTSIILLEAAVLGRPALSIQPGRRGADGFVSNQRGLIELVADEVECRRQLARAIHEPAEWRTTRRALAAERGFDGKATARIMDLIYREINLDRERRAADGDAPR